MFKLLLFYGFVVASYDKDYLFILFIYFAKYNVESLSVDCEGELIYHVLDPQYFLLGVHFFLECPKELSSNFKNN